MAGWATYSSIEESAQRQVDVGDHLVLGHVRADAAKGFESRFVSFETGARIEIMRTTMLAPVKYEAGAQRMGLTHFAVSLGSEQHVNELTDPLRRDGHPILDGPRRTGDGYYESVTLDPDGNRIELVA